MPRNVRALIQVLLVNTPRSHLHSSCAAGMNSGLAASMTLTRVLRGELGIPVTCRRACFRFRFFTVVHDCWDAF